MIVAIVLAALLTRTVEQSDVFRPPPPPRQTFAQMAKELKASQLTFQSGDGTALRGFLFRAADADAPYVLLFYGNAQLAPFESDRLIWLRKLGYNAVCFDYRGYGYSAGTAGAQKIRDDSLSLYDYIVRELERSGKPAFVYGVSLGTQFAIHVAASRPVRALILQSPAASAEEEVSWYGHEYLGVVSAFIRLTPDANVRTIFQGRAEIARTAAPLLVVHGSQDRLIPIAQAREVFEASPATDKRFVEVPNAGHGDIPFDKPPTAPAVIRFLSSHSGA